METMPGFDKREVIAATPQAELMAVHVPSGITFSMRSGTFGFRTIQPPVN
jgi:hypothetical protein